MTDPRLALIEQARILLAAAEVTPGPVRSPCMSVCRMDAASDLCEGCLRTLHEIGAWSDLDRAQRLAVWQRIEQRAQGGPSQA
jgi:predicted Fe-S protein YdhL (DUF1289 family)